MHKKCCKKLIKIILFETLYNLVVLGELLVIVEYCRYGNLHNYLLRHREDFINQIDPMTSKIDYNIGYEEMERTFSISSDGSNRSTRGTNMADYRANSLYNGRSVNTETTEICMTPSANSKYYIIQIKKLLIFFYLS